MADILEVCHDLPLVVVPAGSNVIEVGKKLGSLFVLVEGAVAIERDGMTVAELREPGAILGEMSVLLDRPASTTVRATVESAFLVARDGATYLVQRPDVAIEVARALATRLEALTSYLADVKHQFAEHPGHMALVHEVMKTLIHDKLPVVQSGSVRMPEVEY